MKKSVGDFYLYDLDFYYSRYAYYPLLNPEPTVIVEKREKTRLTNGLRAIPYFAVYPHFLLK